MQFSYKKKSFDIEGVSQDDYIYQNISNTQSFYEEDLLSYMYYVVLNFQHRKKKTVAIDVGANIGNHSIFMRSFLADYLIAIEPNPNVLPVLHKNLSRNIEKYKIYECGVGENEGLGTISVTIQNNIGTAKISTDGNDNSIKIHTLDSIVYVWQETQNEDCDISVIKIDVEGMELSVLKGAEKLIAEHKPHIFVEAATTEEYLRLNDYLQDFGYEKLSKWAATPVYHFVFKPDLLLIMRVYVYIKIFEKLRRIKKKIRRIKKRLKSRFPER